MSRRLYDICTAAIGGVVLAAGLLNGHPLVGFVIGAANIGAAIIPWPTNV